MVATGGTNMEAPSTPSTGGRTGPRRFPATSSLLRPPRAPRTRGCRTSRPLRPASASSSSSSSSPTGSPRLQRDIQVSMAGITMLRPAPRTTAGPGRRLPSGRISINPTRAVMRPLHGARRAAGPRTPWPIILPASAPPDGRREKHSGPAAAAELLTNTKVGYLRKESRARICGTVLRTSPEPVSGFTGYMCSTRACGPGQGAEPEGQGHQDLRGRPGVQHSRSTRTICRAFPAATTLHVHHAEFERTGGHLQADREGDQAPPRAVKTGRPARRENS